MSLGVHVQSAPLLAFRLYTRRFGRITFTVVDDWREVDVRHMRAHADGLGAELLWPASAKPVMVDPTNMERLARKWWRKWLEVTR